MKIHDILIIGGGTTGTSLLYTLARYTNASSICLVEKYGIYGGVNSAAHNNSQTLHAGPIESNYPISKVFEVYPRAMTTVGYLQELPTDLRQTIMFDIPNMLLGVGTQEVAIVTKRYHDLKESIPNLQLITDRAKISELEPKLVEGRDPSEEICVLLNKDGKAINSQKLSESFVSQAHTYGGPRVQTHLNTEVTRVFKADGDYVVETNDGDMKAKVVVVCCDAHSLTFAKRMGYGNEFSLIPIAATMYFVDNCLNYKVYTVQPPLLPFAGMHGDHDIAVPGKTRFGPTARLLPVLESGNWKTTGEYLSISGLQKWKTWKAFLGILGNAVRRNFLILNTLYELPLLGKYLVAKKIQKIVPSVRAHDLTYAKGFGGMRLQRVDINSGELLLGEGKIMGDNVIFNMTPSPGASVCLYNAFRDAETISKFLGGSGYEFDTELAKMDTSVNTSLEFSYPS